MAEFTIHDDSPVAGTTVAAADRFDSLTFAAIIRDDDVVIPRGDTCLLDGDRVVVIGSPESVGDFATTMRGEIGSIDDVLIVGGSDIGRQTADVLSEEGIGTRLIEPDPEHARVLAEALPDTTVLNADPTDQEFLEREHIAEVDVVVAALGNDEQNLLAGLLAKRMGADRAIAVVEEGSYIDLFEAVGIDVAVNPRKAIAEEITRFTRERHAENVAMLESDRAEVLEIEVDEASVLTGRPIAESIGDLPDGVVIGAITRDGAFVQPRGDTVIERGDHIVVFADTDVLDDAMTDL
jgi:trk system potassium uptake protein TrkA